MGASVDAGIIQVADFFADLWRSMCIGIDIVLTKLLSFLYSLFYYTATAKFKDETLFEQIIENVGKIIGIIVLFSVAISFVQYVVNPDKFTDAKVGVGKLVTKILISLALLTSVNSIFDMAYDLEDLITKNKVIEKILLPRDGGFYSGESTDVGNVLAAEVLFTFITDNTNAGTTPATSFSASDLKTKMQTAATIDGGNAFLALLQRDINIKNEENKEYYYKYTTFLPGVIMAVFGWIFISYTFSVGVRIVQLFFLQIIAPLPIMMYVLPNGDDKLKNWVKQCTTTYLDLFIRFFIINFALVLIKSFAEGNLMLNDLSGSNKDLEGWIKVAIMLAVLMFAKKAPELIKELFPSKGAASGDFGVSLKNRFKDNAAGAVVGGVAGGLAGMATGAIANKGFLGKLGGAFGGLTRGTLGGLTGKKTADIMKKTADKGALQRQGIGSFEQLSRNLGNKFGAETEMQKIDRKLKDNAIKRQGYDTAIANNESKLKLAESIKSRATSQAYKKNISATIGAGKIKDAYNHDDAITFSDINRVKDSIERSRNTGNEFFTVDGREYHTSSADAFLKLAEKEAGKMVIASGTDDILNNNVREYDDIFFNIGAGPNDDKVDANHLYDSFTDREERISAIRGTDDYKALKSEQEELERQKSRVRGQ